MPAGPLRGGRATRRPAGALWADRLSNTTCTSRSRGTCRSMSLKNARTSLAVWRAAGVVEHLAGGDVQRGEQIGGAVALVVMGHRPGPARLHRQRRLGAVQCLALGLLVEAEHHGPLRRVQVQADDIDELLLEAGVVGQLERLDPPRLEVPGPATSGPRCPCRPRDRSAIVRVDQCVEPSSGRRAACRPRSPRSPSSGSSRLAAPTRRDPTHTARRPASNPAPPPTHRVRRRVAAPGDLLVRHPIGREQQSLGLHHLADAATTTTAPSPPAPPAAHRDTSNGAATIDRHAATLTHPAISATDH